MCGRDGRDLAIMELPFGDGSCATTAMPRKKALGMRNVSARRGTAALLISSDWAKITIALVGSQGESGFSAWNRRDWRELAPLVESEQSGWVWNQRREALADDELLENKEGASTTLPPSRHPGVVTSPQPHA